MAEDTVVVRPPIRELAKYSMFADIPGVEGKKARLAWSMREAGPRITVYTNSPSDTINYGIISAPMNPETFFITLSLLEKITTGPKDTKKKIACLTSNRNSDGSMGERVIQSEVIIGKDSEGIVWMSVIAENRPKIKFSFRIYDYHKIYNGDGNQMSEEESSVLQAQAVITALKNIYSTLTGELKPVGGGIRQPGSYGGQATPLPKTDSAAVELDDITF
jgi:hypothetical protein